MDKLCVYFLIAAFSNEAFGQAVLGQNLGLILRQNQFRGQNWCPWHPALCPNPQTTSTTLSPSTTTDRSTTSTTLSPEVLECKRNCPVTPEYNPVCGTNNVTYDNPGRLTCAQWCGVDVSIKRVGRCPPPPAPEDESN